MKKNVLVILSVIVLAAIGGYSYFDVFLQKKTDIWQMIPGTAVFAYENGNTITSWNEIIEKPIYQSLQKIPKIDVFKNTIEEIDSLTGSEGIVDRLFRNRHFIASAHITSSTEFDFIVFLELDSKKKTEDLDRIIEAVSGNYDFLISQRQYQGVEINELQQKSSNRSFSFIVHHNILAGSFTPMLIEDVIRHINNKFKDGFDEKIASLKGLSKLSNDEGNIYVNFSQIPSWFSVFLDPELSDIVRRLGEFTQNAYFDLKVTDHEVLLNGTSTAAPGKPMYFVNVFRTQNAAEIGVVKHLPLQTALFYDLTFSDYSTFLTDLTRHWSATDEDQMQRFLEIDSEFNFETDWIGNEIALAIMEPSSVNSADAIVFIKMKDRDKAASQLLDFTDQYLSKTGDSLFIEQYGDHQIVQISYPELPARLFGPSFVGFKNGYFTYFNEYIVIGNSIQAVKFFLNENEQENNWGKSVRQNLFLENTLSEANLSIMFNTAKCWNFLQKNLNENWLEIFNRFKQPIAALDMVAFQMSNLDNRYYTSLVIGHGKSPDIHVGESSFTKIHRAYTLSPIVSKPTLVRNHNNNRTEILLQDSLNYLYLISHEGEILWADSLGERIVTDILQIDYFKNKKLQYFFASSKKIFLLDRNGDFVAGFPFTLPGNTPADHLNVMDYDNTKNYRFILADQQGNIFLFDKNKKNLEGWTPRKTGGRLSSPPFHIRVKGGDCILSLEQKGVLNVMKRRGTMYPGFPVDLKQKISSYPFVRIGNDFQSTNISVITDAGELIQINLYGKITNRIQLFRGGAESEFMLIPDALNKDFVIVRQDFNNLSFHDENGDLLFERNFITSGKLQVQYYNYGINNKIFVVLDEEQEFAYIYNESGELINFEPLESGFPVALIYTTNDRSFKLYKAYFNRYSMLEFK